MKIHPSFTVPVFLNLKPQKQHFVLSKIMVGGCFYFSYLGNVYLFH